MNINAKTDIVVNVNSFDRAIDQVIDRTVKEWIDRWLEKRLNPSEAQRSAEKNDIKDDVEELISLCMDACNREARDLREATAGNRNGRLPLFPLIDRDVRRILENHPDGLLNSELFTTLKKKPLYAFLTYAYFSQKIVRIPGVSSIGNNRNRRRLLKHLS